MKKELSKVKFYLLVIVGLVVLSVLLFLGGQEQAKLLEQYPLNPIYYPYFN